MIITGGGCASAPAGGLAANGIELLASGRRTPGGETTFLAACVYRLLGYRPLSIGDVLTVRMGTGRPTGWPAITTGSGQSASRPTGPGSR